MRRINLKLSALFFFSIGLIAYELFVMRVFSVGSWSNFGSMIISTALLGFGLAGTLLTFLHKTVKATPNKWLSLTALATMPAMVLCFAAAQTIPFNPTFVGVDGWQLVWIGAFYLIYGIPFFLGALFIGISFIVLSSRMHKLYFWNMCGSGLGGLVIIGFMFFLPTASLLLPIVLMIFLAAVLCVVRLDHEQKRVSVKKSYLIALPALLLFSLGVFIADGQIRVSKSKPIFFARNYEDSVVAGEIYSPAGEMHVFQSSYFHSAPGMSMNASQNIESVPRQPFCGLYIDGNGPIVIMGRALPEEKIFLDYLPVSAPYAVKEKPDVLLVNLGGGINIEVAKHHNASALTVVEPNPEIIRLYRDDPFVSRFTGFRLRDPDLQVRAGEPRAFCMRNRERFDIVEISLIDSVGLSWSGGDAVQENFTYTTQAVKEYMYSLKPDGILSITVWDRLKPPRNVVKILSTVVESLKEYTTWDPEGHLFVFNYLNSTATVLVKKTPFTPDEITGLKQFVDKLSMDLVYYPGMPSDGRDLQRLINYYSSWFTDDPEVMGNKPDYVKPAQFYRTALMTMLADREEELYTKYLFDVRPMSDDRPYYSVFLKPERLSLFIDQLPAVSEEWGYLLLLAVLIQSVVFGALIILLPLVGRWRELFKGKRGTAGVIVYYACLGLGYMLVEMFLIQRLVFFLSNPMISVSIVITAMLIISGIGSICSSYFPWEKKKRVRRAAAGIVVSLVFYMVGLAPLLSALLGIPFPVKLIVVVLLIAPAAFFLGMPFPNGLSALAEYKPRMLPWAWGMNGALSVTGTVLGRLLSVSFGFSTVLLTAIAVYVAAGFLFTANEGAVGIEK
jgi:hypothetical protein